MSTTTPPTAPMPTCPGCRVGRVVRNGLTHTGTPNFRCRGCGRQFVEAPLKGPVRDETRALVLRLLGERMALRAIARVTGLSRSWLQRFVNALYREQTPHDPGVLAPRGDDLVIEADEMWGFVGGKFRQVWVWAALDAGTRQVVAMVAGDRSEATARALFEALPQEYRDGAIFLTDFWPAYRAALPQGRHGECGKGDGLTNHVERSWCTLRQRCARFVRKTLSFSKCPLNHVGALWFFIRLYNQSLL